MQWSVEGANEETGDEVAVVVEAASRILAESEARRRGVLVASITPLEQLSPVDEVSLAYRARQAKGPSSLAYQSNAAVPTVPKYVGLRIAASILSIVAILYYAAGLILFASIAYAGLRRTFVPYGMEGLIFSVGPTFMLLAVGGLCHGVSAACLALRDIAINSFARRG